MKKWLLNTYDFFVLHRSWLWAVVGVFVLLVALLAATLRYDEDIMDFLPVSSDEKAQLSTQAAQSASRIVLVIEGGDEVLREEILDDLNSQFSILNTQFVSDPSEQIAELYSHLPALVSDSVYARLDSFFTPEAVRGALERDRIILTTPGTSFLMPAIQADPLGLVTMDMKQWAAANGQKTYAFLDSPYGSTETKKNGELIDSLNQILSAYHLPADTSLSIRLTGAPVIAVGNARRIKTDTLLCIGLSLVLIVVLLMFAFPRKRDLVLILLSVSFGWLFGMAVLRLVVPTVSAIVLGIGSVLIGIAVNYPLHLLVHQRYTTSVRQTLDEVLSPLVVGNITTVGAFMALIPLQATALRHLGIFASAMLVGTILFCIFVLPHLMSAEPTPVREIKLPFSRLKPFIPNSKFIPWMIVGVTVVAAVYLGVVGAKEGLGLFDANLTHINYMTPEQQSDMAGLDQVHISNDKWKLWTEYWSSHDAETTVATIQKEAAEAGFRPEAFQPFYDQITHPQSPDEAFSFNKIAERLSADFDYIGACCSLIVFVFLWISFKKFSLALLAFMPMALSWIWIFAIMHLTGLQFNIVNIILATFIFGQGDDYTIFIVEGLLYERRTGKVILPQYRQSIILSALIMLLGIGILVFAVHPAMHSLGLVTLIGMSVVLLMAFTIPPFLFRYC